MIPVLWSGPGLLAVDKPPGMAVVPGRDAARSSLRQLLEAQLGRPVWIVHRLDRDTSGVLLVALDAEMHRAASQAFESGQAQKRYLAGLFPLRTETNESLASVLADMALYGLGDDWLDRYRDRVRSVTRAEAAAAAARYCFPEPPLTVVVGPAEQLRSTLEPLAPVDVVTADAVL